MYWFQETGESYFISLGFDFQIYNMGIKMFAYFTSQIDVRSK